MKGSSRPKTKEKTKNFSRTGHRLIIIASRSASEMSSFLFDYQPNRFCCCAAAFGGLYSFIFKLRV
jgi:hypothetical protein